MSRLRVIGVSMILAGAAFWPLAAAAAPKVLTAGEAAISLEWDPAWKEAKPPAGAPPNAAQFETANPHDLMVVVVVEFKPPGANPDPYMRESIESLAKALLTQSVETVLPAEPFGSGDTRGYRVCATDKAPKAEEYKYICEGLAANGDVVVSFTVLYNEAGKASAQQALKAFESVRDAKLR